jgi:hypothetical protein
MKSKAFDIAVSLAIIVAAGLVYWDARKYKAGVYDPLGSGTMPKMIAVAIIVLCIVAILQTLFTRPRPKRADAQEAESFKRRPWLAFLIFLYTVACAVLLYLKVPFGVTASLTLFVSILAIKRYDRSVLLPGAICSIAFGFGLTYLFGSVFGVDLP